MCHVSYVPIFVFYLFLFRQSGGASPWRVINKAYPSIFFFKSKVCVQQFAFHVLFTELAPRPIQSQCQVVIKHLVTYIYLCCYVRI